MISDCLFLLTPPLCHLGNFSLVLKNEGTAVAQAQAQHPDGTRRGISYSLFSGNRKKAFIINSSTGKMLLDVNIVSIT